MESLIIQLIAAGVGTLGFAMLYNVRGKKLFWATFGGFLGWAFYDFLHLFTDSNYLSCFGAAMLLHIYAEWMARRQKTPATVFFVAAAIPLIGRAALPHDVSGYGAGVERICGSGSLCPFVRAGHCGGNFMCRCFDVAV